MLLTLTLAGQYLYFQRERLALDPTLRPLVETLCHYAGCRLPLRQDLRQVEILEHRLATHPAVPDAVVLRLVLVNNAPFPQPFPDLRVTFYNMVGQAVAMRQFAPHEYLDPSVDPRRGMPPDLPIPVQLTLVDPGPDAPSHELQLVARRRPPTPR